MTLFGVRRPTRAIDALGVLSAILLVASVVNLSRAMEGAAEAAGADGAGSVARPDPDLVDRCGADVLLVADSTMPAGHLADAGRALAGSVAGSGTRLGAVVSGDQSATLLGDGLLEVTDASNAPGGSIDLLLEALAGSTGRQDGRSWAAGLEQARDLAQADPAGRSLLVVLLTNGPGPAEEPAAAIAAELESRPRTRLLAVGTGAAADLGTELAALAGPDVAPFGARTLDVARDDVVLVPDEAGLVAALDELGRGLCATRIEVAALDSSTAPPSPRAGLGLALGVTGDGSSTTVAPAAGTLVTDSRGLAAWQVGVAPGTTTSLTLLDASAPSGGRSLTCLGADGVATSGSSTHLVVTGVPAGADLRCQLRLLDESRPLRLRLVPFPGDVSCPDDLTGLVALTAAPIGSPITYCLELVNEGRSTAYGVQVDVPGLTPVGGAWVFETELPPTARAQQRYVTTLDGPAPIEATATAQGTAGATAGAFVGLVPPAVSTEKLAPGDPACGDPVESPRGCYRVTNTGGSWLDQLNLVPASMDTPLSLERRISPGEAVLLRPPTTDPLALPTEPTAAASEPMGPPSELAGPPAAGTADGGGSGEGATAGPEAVADAVATARAVDAGGEPLPGAAPVSSAARPADAPLLIDPIVSDEAVPLGDSVDFGLTVSNPVGGVSYAAAQMTDTACAQPGTSSELTGNGDSSLDPGETWLFACSAPIEVEVLSMAAVFAQDQTSTTLEQVTERPRPVRAQVPDLRIKKSQENDLVPGSQTVYELKVQNTGQHPAPNVVVIDPLPAGLTFVAATATAGACGHNGGVVSCSLGTIAVQESAEAVFVRITVEAQASVADQVVRNDASVTSDAGDVDPSDNTSFVRARAGVCQRDCQPVGLDNQGNNQGNNSADDSVVVGGEQLVRTGVDTVAASAWGFVLLASGMSLVATARRRWALAALPR